MLDNLPERSVDPPDNVRPAVHYYNDRLTEAQQADKCLEYLDHVGNDLFLTWLSEKHPEVILKYVEELDGFWEWL